MVTDDLFPARYNPPRIPVWLRWGHLGDDVGCPNVVLPEVAVETLPLTFATGWASGISAYAVALVIGLIGRLGWADTPEVLQRTDVLVVAGVLTAIELVVDKIPYLDSTWDTIHTVVRPLVAAVLGALIAADADTTNEALTAAGTAVVAFLSHLSKAGIRLGVNASPEPVTNVGVSAAEDVTVVTVAALAWEHPWAAAGIALVLLVLGLTLAAYLFSRVRRGWQRLGERLRT
jgi:Domain of unknown function (DUF4126)